MCIREWKFVFFAGIQKTNMNTNSLTESEHFHQFPVQGNYKIALLCWRKDHMLWQQIKEHQNFKCIRRLSTNMSLHCLIKHIVHILRAHMAFDSMSQLTNDWRLKLQRHMRPSLVDRLKKGMTKKQICVSTCVSFSSSMQVLCDVTDIHQMRWHYYLLYLIKNTNSLFSVAYYGVTENWASYTYISALFYLSSTENTNHPITVVLAVTSAPNWSYISKDRRILAWWYKMYESFDWSRSD